MDTEINLLCERYDRNDEIVLSNAYLDGGIDPLFPRLIRAALNLNWDGAPARYGIFATTVRDNIIKGMELLDSKNVEDAKKLFTRAANAMSAFADVQASHDPSHDPQDHLKQKKSISR